MRILLTILLCSIDSPFIFILFTIVNVLPRKVSIFSPSFMVSNSNSLLKACNCVIFTFVEPWYFCFTDSQIALEVLLSRIVSRISLSMDWNKKFLVFKSFNFASSTDLLCTSLACVVSIDISGIPSSTRLHNSLLLRKFSIVMDQKS